MNSSTSMPPNWGHIVSVQRGDRWSIYRRLQELDIPCACPADGTLRVEVNHAVGLFLVRSTVRQFLASRGESLDWLERCWENAAICSRDR